MKKFLNIIVAVIIAFSISGCEKDDICASTTPTTPRIVIDFYNRENNDVLKNVTRLTAKGIDEEIGIVFNENGTEITKYQTNANRLSLPLKLNSETTQYVLTQYSDTEELTNSDTITFNYSTRQLYVSRACGYKINFRLNDADPAKRELDGNEWISNIVVETTNIETENETHIKIYF